MNPEVFVLVPTFLLCAPASLLVFRRFTLPALQPIMSDFFEQLVQVGFDIIGTKYYATGVEALYFYDYFLTLQDEVEYAWRGKKTWLFYMFILNRYIPMFYAAWTSAAISLIYPKSACDRTAIIGLIFFVWATFVAQVFLIVRIHALTRRNRMVTGSFVVLTTAQAILGIVFIASPDNTAIRLPEIKLEPFHICMFASNIKLESAYTSLSLAFDSCAFIAIVISAYKSLPSSQRGLKFTGVIGTVVQDATIYFTVIFTSHLTLTMFIFFARESLKLTPAPGNNLFLPMMVSRLVLSLKKSVDPRSAVEWRVDHFTRIEATDANQMNFPMRPTRRPLVVNGGSGTPCWV